MRFNDYHKQVCAALKLSPEQGREHRTLMLRQYTQRHTANACITIVRLEMERLAKEKADGPQAA